MATTLDVAAPHRPTWRPAARAAASAAEWLFGLGCVLVGLAVLASLPVAQFLSLGYLLEAGGRVARTGRLRDALIGVRPAARLGGVVAAAWLLFLPARFAADLAHSAAVIDPGGAAARGWRAGAALLAALTAAHVVAAVALGGRFRHFLWPLTVVTAARAACRRGAYARSRDAAWEALAALRLPYYLWLGVRAFAAAFAWLAVPVTLLAAGRGGTPLATLAGWAGALLLGWVLLSLPFLQLRLARDGRFASAFDRRAARAEVARAPWLSALAVVATLAAALPLYLLKVEVVPREAAWLPGLVFIAFAFPARVLTGWALARAAARPAPRHWSARWLGWLPLLPAAAVYVLVVFLSQYTSWNGVWGLYEQHAFLLPVPFAGPG